MTIIETLLVLIVGFNIIILTIVKTLLDKANDVMVFTGDISTVNDKAVYKYVSLKNNKIYWVEGASEK